MILYRNQIPARIMPHVWMRSMDSPAAACQDGEARFVIRISMNVNQVTI